MERAVETFVFQLPFAIFAAIVLPRPFAGNRRLPASYRSLLQFSCSCPNLLRISGLTLTRLQDLPEKKQVADFQLRLLRCRLSCLSEAEGGGRVGVGGGGGSFRLSACYMQPLPVCNSGFSRLHIRVCMRLPAAVSAKECAL